LLRIVIGAVLAAATVSGAAAQEASKRGRALSLLQMDSDTLRTVEAVADVASSWVGARPAAVSEFPFTNTRAFDMQVHESLKAKLPRVNVLVDGDFGAQAVPERMSQWLNRVRSSGGQVRTCVLSDGPATRSLGLAAAIALKLAQKADAWRVYQPGGSYDALLLVDGDGRTLRNVVFTARGEGVVACPGTRAAPAVAVLQSSAAVPGPNVQPEVAAAEAPPSAPQPPEQPPVGPAAAPAEPTAVPAPPTEPAPPVPAPGR
jgi:hypothetical protein